MQISRSNVTYFKHNDMADLERILQQIEKEESKVTEESSISLTFLREREN